jgi:hypothetical protein
MNVLICDLAFGVVVAERFGVVVGTGTKEM